MPLDPQTVSQFKAYYTTILNKDPLRQCDVVHSFTAWKTIFSGSSPALRALLECQQFLQHRGKANQSTMNIGRSDIFDACDTGLDGRARFLMQMLWGHDPKDNRAKKKIVGWFENQLLVNHQDYLDLTNSIKAGDLKRAFSKLCGIRNLNTSYATKVLYFEARRYMPLYPLIMDDRASAGLIRLTSPLASNCLCYSAPRLFLDLGKGLRAQNVVLNSMWSKYWAYVDACHELASYFNTSADHVEYFLFDF